MRAISTEPRSCLAPRLKRCSAETRMRVYLHLGSLLRAFCGLSTCSSHTGAHDILVSAAAAPSNAGGLAGDWVGFESNEARNSTALNVFEVSPEDRSPEAV